VCPACYHQGSYYAINETWQDPTKCINYTCLEVVNPCAPTNRSTQIEVDTPICQDCPAGYKTVPNNEKCCPDCVPTANIPSDCNVATYGKHALTQDNPKHGICVSDKKYTASGCSGLCTSTVMATLGSGLYTPTCQCCQPLKVKQHNVSMSCPDNHSYTEMYHEILSCECRKQSCTAKYNVGDVEISTEDGSAIKEKRSLFDRLEDGEQMDDATLQRHRRSLLNDLAMIHAQKKKR